MKIDRTRGVTLLELLVVLALLGAAAGVAAPHVYGMMERLEVRAGALRVASAFTRARLAALAHGRPWRVRIVDARTLTVGPDGAPARRVHLPGAVRFVGATSGGEVRFRPNGWAENATFTLGRGPRARSVVVNQRGRITVRSAGGS